MQVEPEFLPEFTAGAQMRRLVRLGHAAGRSQSGWRDGSTSRIRPCGIANQETSPETRFRDFFAVPSAGYAWYPARLGSQRGPLDWMTAVVCLRCIAPHCRTEERSHGELLLNRSGILGNL